MSIAIVLLFQASTVLSEHCVGLQFHTETDGGANLECKLVQTQTNAHPPIPAGIEGVFINNAEYPDCTLQEQRIQTDQFGQNNAVLYYKCPSGAPLPPVQAVLNVTIQIVFASGTWVGSNCAGTFSVDNLAYTGFTELECPTVVFTPGNFNRVGGGENSILVNGEPYENCRLNAIEGLSNVVMYFECPGVPL